MTRIRALILLSLVLIIVLAAVFLPIEQIVMALREWAVAKPGQAMLGTMLFITVGFLLMLLAIMAAS